jgi:hypothetical protein
MSATHKVKVLEKTDRTVKLRLSTLIPEVPEVCLAPNCALQILWDKAHPDFGKQGPLADAMSEGNRLDAHWLLEHQDQFIESVTLLETANYPVPPEQEFVEMRKKGVLPEATIEIRVTDEKWIAHLRRGATWDTAPFDASI